MTRNEILDIERGTEKQLAGVNLTLERINKFFVFSLILHTAIARNNLENIKQVCEILADNSFPVKEENNEIVSFFRGIEAKLEPVMEKATELLLPSTEILKSWIEWEAITDKMKTAIWVVHDRLKTKFPKLPYPYRGLVTKLNSAATEAERASKCIFDLIRKFVEHDTKTLKDTGHSAVDLKTFDVDFQKINAEVALKLPYNLHKLDKATIKEIQKTWPKGLFRKVFLNVFGEEETEEDFLTEVEDEYVDAFTQTPKETTERNHAFTNALSKLFVVGVILADTLDDDPSPQEFQDLCETYLKQVKEIQPEENVMASYLESAQEQINARLRNSNDFVVPTSKVVAFWTHTRAMYGLFVEGIQENIDRIEESPLSKNPSCVQLISMMQTAIAESNRIVNLIKHLTDVMMAHNEVVNKIPSRKKAISLDYLDGLEHMAEKMIPVHSMYLQQLALDALEELQDASPTPQGEEIEDEAFLLHADLVNELLSKHQDDDDDYDEDDEDDDDF